jgi:ribonuclease HI
MATTTIRSFRTISTDSSLIIGNWLPFDLRIRQLAILAGIKMNINFSTPYPGHVQFIRADINSCGLTLTDLDYLKPSPLQSLPPWSPQPFSIHVDQRYLPPLCPTVNGHYNIYTDGSKTTVSTGYAVLIINKDRDMDIVQRRLDADCSIFEAETRAITEALRFCNKYLPPGSVVNIFTDALQVISSITSKKRILRFTHQLQRSILYSGKMFQIHLHWVKGHSTNEGNRLADTYARQTELLPRSNSKNLLSWKNAKIKVASFLQTIWKEEWKLSTKGAVTRAFFPTPEDAAILKHVNLSHELTQLLTGHNKLRAYLHRISAVDSPLCECQAADETTEHFLFHCPFHETQRETV